MSDTATILPRTVYSSPRQQQRQHRILTVVREQISAKGYDGINMREIAAISGVAPKTLYNLYGSKDELLLAAVDELLHEVRRQESAMVAEQGVMRYLAHTESIARQIISTPAYADTMARTLFQVGRDHPLVDLLLGNAVRLAQDNLQQAQLKEELKETIELAEIAQTLVSHQWGIVLLWNKGIISSESLPSIMQRSNLLVLIPLCKGKCRENLEQQLSLL